MTAPTGSDRPCWTDTSSHLSAEHPVVLIRHTADIFKVAPHLDGALGLLGQVRMREAGLTDGLLDLGIEQCVTTPSLELGQDPGAVERNPLAAREFDQEIDDPEREQSAPTARNCSRDIRECKSETYGFVAMRDDLDQPRVC